MSDRRRRIGMIVTVVVLIAITIGVSQLLGHGDTAVLSALIGVFCMIAASGGPLRSDLRLLAVFGPGLVVATSAPRLLAEVSVGGAIALVTAVAFVAGLVPALGVRYHMVGLGLGLSTLAAYGLQLAGSTTAGQVVGASVLAVAVAVALRVVVGLRDPSAPTRQKIAAVFDADHDPAVGEALRTWLEDRPVRWLGEVLGAGTRYRMLAVALDHSRRLLPPAQAAEVQRARDRAAAAARSLAERIRAAGGRAASADPVAEPSAAGPDGEPPATGADVPAAARGLLADLDGALHRATAALDRRDDALAPVPPLRRSLLRASLGAALSWRSARFRHALRCAVGVLAALLVTRLRPDDPLMVNFLVTTFIILQVSWEETLSKARERIGGTVVGAAALALALVALPSAGVLAQLLVAVAALLVMYWFLQSRPLVSNAAMILVMVGVRSSTAGMDLAGTLLELAVLIIGAVLLGLLFGFAVVPGVRAPTANELLRRAVAATRQLVATAAAADAEPASRRRTARAMRDAVQARQDLVAPAAGRGPAPHEHDALAQAADALDGLAVASLALAREPGAASADLWRLADALALVHRQPAAVADRLASGWPPAGDEAGLLHASIADNLDRLATAALAVRSVSRPTAMPSPGGVADG